MHKVAVLLFSVLTIFARTGVCQEVLTVEKAAELALSNNYQVRIARINEVVQQTNNTAGNAGFLPEVALNFGQAININNTKQEFFSGDIRQGNNVQTSNLNTNLQIGWTVFDGFRMFVNRDRLNEMQAQGAMNVRFQMENTLAQVMSLFYRIEEQQKRIQTVRDAIAFSQQRIDILNLRLAAGTISSLPLLQAKVDMNSDSSMLIMQIQQLKALQIQLNEAIGIDPATEFVFVPSEGENLDNIEQFLAGAEERNSQLRLADMNIRMAELNVKGWQTNRYPTIDINAGYNFTRFQAEIGILKFNQNNGASFGLTGRWSLFNGWNNKREIQIARLGVENSKLSREMTLQQLKADLLNAYSQYVAAKDRVFLENKNTALAQENLTISTEKLKTGTITPLELRQAQLNLIDTEFRKVAAASEMKLQVLTLKHLSGSLIR